MWSRRNSGYMTILRETFYRRSSLKMFILYEGFFLYQFPVLATQALLFYFFVIDTKTICL
jgi:hypothetical protein